MSTMTHSYGGLRRWHVSVLATVLAFLAVNILVARFVRTQEPPLRTSGEFAWILGVLVLTSRNLRDIERLEQRPGAADDEALRLLFRLTSFLPIVGYLPMLSSWFVKW